jgi:hypothetical protein
MCLTMALAVMEPTPSSCFVTWDTRLWQAALQAGKVTAAADV